MNRGPAEAVSERVAEVLAERILSGGLTPGARIKQDELAAQLGISRIPVRDALRMLESRGLVTMRANTGARVVLLDEADLAAAFDIRERLEPLLLADSLAHFTQDDVAVLGGMLEQDRGISCCDTLVRDGRDFHWYTYSRHSSTLLAGTVERVWDMMQSYVLAAWLRMTQSELVAARANHFEEHRVLYEAIAKGQLETAQAILVLHIRRIRTAVLAGLREPELVDEPEPEPAN